MKTASLTPQAATSAAKATPPPRSSAAVSVKAKVMPPHVPAASRKPAAGAAAIVGDDHVPESHPTSTEFKQRLKVLAFHCTETASEDKSCSKSEGRG